MVTTHGFELLREAQIEELRTTARFYRHVKTGAQLLSLINDDENKVFGITFRTPVSDSTGVPHIMEHSVLCGSRKYPVKEPFIELARGSLNTFLNAMTYPDKTAYPVASTNLQDFYNLVDVYLDSVLYPLISEHTLQQEGWHYELEGAADPLTYKGVVFNEMKGVYAAPDTVLGHTIQASLFPDTTYAFESGGHPEHIPDLTYAQFKAFHETFYHPSNAFLYFYGDDDPDERLRLLDGWLKDFDRLTVDSEIRLQPRFEASRRVTVPYAIGPDTDAARKSMVTVNWLLGETTDVVYSLAWQILAHILAGTQAAPLRRALIDSGLGEDLAGGGLTDELRQMTYAQGLKGVAAADVDKVEAIVLDTVRRLAVEGLDKETVEASLNTVEFSLREINTGSYPRGLAMMFWSLGSWLYGGDPLAPLAFEQPLEDIKARVARGERPFEALIESDLLNNHHRTTVILHPDAQVGAQEEATERARLDAAREGMTADDLQHVIEEARLLKELQAKPDSAEALAAIPSLTLADLPTTNKTIPLAVEEHQGARLLYHDLFTNGVAYLDLAFDLRALPQDLLPYVPLFGRALLEMGTEREDFIKLSQRIGSKTGGISRASRSSLIRGTDQTAAHFFLRGKGMLHQTADLLDILRDVLLSVRLDNQSRFRQMALEAKARQEQSIIYGGHAVVASRLSARFNAADWVSEQMGGLSNLYFTRGLIDQIDSDWPAVLAALERVRATLVNRAGLTVNVTLDADNWRVFAPQLDAFLAALPARPVSPQTWLPTPTPDNEGLIIPGQINYVGKGADLYKMGYEYDGSLAVVSRVLNTTFLWERVRVQGGAYGGFGAFDRFSGVFNFLSYRDPNLTETLINYDEAAAYLRRLDMPERELTRSIVGAIGDMDTYRLPDAKGWVSMERYLLGESDAMRQAMRDQVLSTSLSDFHRFGETLEAVKDHGHVVVLGAQAAIESAAEARPGWLTVSSVGL